ncbi:zinc fingers and homeoboxes protein 2 [Triplophysa dalaica]|uniref:zinc fingers and homeoboxes protein 2 n=1 Tax=Triplophysa dalaica TaxID=1582913 RepID=UPI0024DFD085|nr:zinc fingers and homeoboxes protein 2 [Triplophysa dalaica]XP_056596818.1 zinc fingers and homeoboxes protein 2 [Triplophysa dalaica]XP_056596819.1 zinc fingers and homeoboxes protein 2 [Triplophysa dalaica]XP_056596821.1 zinc fingers and homeoboxes protein 2 [Triplophysa dalaica]
MSSRRKSFVPCMVLAAESSKDEEQSSFFVLNRHNSGEHEDSSPSEGPFHILYRCSVCSFSATDSDMLSYHHTTQHPDRRFKQITLNESVLQEPEGAGDDPPRDQAQVDSLVESLMLKDDIRAVTVNGTIIIPEPMCHVTPLLRRPPDLSTTPTLAVPLYTNKYNPDLDANSALMASFNRFPYPTHTELSWLTADSKHPEEQIRVWFTTQRLKQGITWSPEEVEEARKTLFNGCAWPPRHTSPHKLSRSDGHVTGAAGSRTLSLQTPLLTSDIERSVCESLFMMPSPAPPVFTERKRSSSASFLASHFKIPAVASWEKALTVPSKEKICVERPARLPMTPLVSTNLKRSAVLQLMNSYTDKRSDMSLPSHVSRPAVVQSPLFPDAAESSRPPSTFTRSSSQNDVRERSVPAHFPLLERVKGKSSGQMQLLEESFQRNSFPSFNEVDHLTIASGLSSEEIESWFLERRALRDDLEQALLNSMGCRKHSPAHSESMSLLKHVCVQTPWPVQLHKGFAHTDVVYGFRAPASGQEEMFGERKGCSRGKLLTEENVKANSSVTEEERFNRRSRQRWPYVNAGEGALGGAAGVCGGVML